MELRVLRYFLAVAKEESITAASETLHVTQPTLSRQLMELEEEFNISIDDDAAQNIKTVGDILKSIDNQNTPSI